MNNLVNNILIYTVILFILILLSMLISYLSSPQIKDTKSTIKNFTDYMKLVYCKNENCKNSKGKHISPYPLSLIMYKQDNLSSNNIPGIINDNKVDIKNTLRFFNYIYDNAPKSILNEFPLAENLSFSWPPKMGERYKLTAFPYPKSSFILSAVFETIRNTVDAYTFPAWCIQRRNPLDFNNSIYNNNYFRKYQDVEVVHACYPPPGQSYPMCDDGGWWLYLATGNCVVSNNKLALLYDLYKCSVKDRRDIAAYNETVKNIKDKKPLPPIVGYSIDDMVNKIKSKGGGNSIMLAIFSIVDALTKHEFQSKIIGFKNLTPSNQGKSAWYNFMSRTFLIIFLITVTFIQMFINIRNKSKKEIAIIVATSLIIVSLLVYIFFFVVFEDFFRKLGWMTLDMALTETNMSLYQFVEECVTGNLKNSICNSLAMTQVFDPETEEYTKMMGYDSFILTSQPNKTGTWEVEICDLRRYKVGDKGVTVDGGICGKNVGSGNELNVSKGEVFDTCLERKIPRKDINTFILKSGPIVLDTSGAPYYKPTTECDCIENSNRLCTSCDGYLSGQLCINP